MTSHCRPLQKRTQVIVIRTHPSESWMAITLIASMTDRLLTDHLDDRSRLTVDQHREPSQLAAH
jgi:hypothetical protein